MNDYLFNFLDIFAESSPWLLFGLLVAGIMNRLIPISLLQRHMAKNDVASVTKAAIIGAPLPLCSCGVIPAALGLRRAGASPSSTISFLVSTPETGVDSISISYALLGPFMAVIRPISAVFTAIVTGLIVMVDNRRQLNTTTQIDSQCCEMPGQNQSKTKEPCCSQKTLEEEKEKLGVVNSIKEVVSFAAGKLLADITKWLLVGLLLAAAIKTWVPTDFLVQWGDGFLAMLVMALVGIPMYICASASTPIAAGFLVAGVSPGAILVFMLAGPATNIATMGMIKQELGSRVLVIYLSCIIGISIMLGYLTNWLVNEFSFAVYSVADITHSMEQSIIYYISAVILASLMIRNMLVKS